VEAEEVKNAALTVTADGDRVLIVVEGADGDVVLTMSPADARDIAAKLLKEAYTIDLDVLFVGQVGEA
jgi:hypothetical protein